MASAPCFSTHVAPRVRVPVTLIEPTNRGQRSENGLARYGQAFKSRAVARLLPPESAAVDEVAREVAISASTLERWRSEELSRPDLGRGGQAACRTSARAARANGLNTSPGNRYLPLFPDWPNGPNRPIFTYGDRPVTALIRVLVASAIGQAGVAQCDSRTLRWAPCPLSKNTTEQSTWHPQDLQARE